MRKPESLEVVRPLVAGLGVVTDVASRDLSDRLERDSSLKRKYDTRADSVLGAKEAEEAIKRVDRYFQGSSGSSSRNAERGEQMSELLVTGQRVAMAAQKAKFTAESDKTEKRITGELEEDDE